MFTKLNCKIFTTKVGGLEMKIADTSIQFSQPAKNACQEILARYTEAMLPLIESNRECSTDYEQARELDLLNPLLRIDMSGLTDEASAMLYNMDQSSSADFLSQNCLYEVENASALWLLAPETSGNFTRRLSELLDSIRSKTGKLIKYFAPTREKYDSMLAEFKGLKGYLDGLIGPDAWGNLPKNALDGCILFTRASLPANALRKGNKLFLTDGNSLGNEEIRREVKRLSFITNIDNPYWEPSDTRSINDTKRYLETLGAGRILTNVSDNTIADEISLAGGPIHVKPSGRCFGSYGQKTLYGRGGETSKLRALLENYGPLIVQKQIEPPEVILNGIPHIYGDRPFFTRANGKYQFAGGFRLFIPSDSIDGQKRMIHGTKNTVYAPLF